MRLAESRLRVALNVSLQKLMLHDFRLLQRATELEIRRQIRRAPKRISDGRLKIHKVVEQSCADRQRSGFRDRVPSNKQVHRLAHGRDYA
jgi:hypothetical protein